MPASSSSFGPNCWLWSGKKWKICIFSMKCTDRQWSTKEENSVLYLPIWLLLVGRYFLYHLGDLPIVSKKKMGYGRVTEDGTGHLHPSELANLLWDLSNVFVPELNPKHVLFIQQGLFLRAIFRLVPGHKYNHIISFRYVRIFYI